MEPQDLPRAASALAQLVAPGGRLLVITSARTEDEPVTTPWRPLTRGEIDSLAVEGLELVELEDFPKQGHLDRRWRALFAKRV